MSTDTYPPKPPEFDLKMVDAPSASEQHWQATLDEAAERVHQELRTCKALCIKPLTRRAVILKAGLSPRFGYQNWLGELTVTWMLASGQIEAHPGFPDRIRHRPETGGAQ